MNRKIIAVVAILAVSIAGTAFAAVENIKVSGNYTAYGISRQSYDLGSVNEAFGDSISGMASVTNLRFDADLTEDILFTYILRDERVWAESSALYTACAFATLKDFLTYPLTLKLGMQAVKLGSGLVLSDPDTNRLGAGALGTTNGLGDLSPRKAFYGAVGIYDLDPATITLGWLKQNEGSIGVDDDTNIYLANVAYDFEDYDTMGELYYVVKDDTERTTSKADISVVGARAVSTILDEAVTLNGEFAYQQQKDFRSDGKTASDRAMAVGATYAFMDVDYAPTLGIDYARLSENWDVMYEAWTPANIANALFTNANCELYGVTLTAEPREDISLKLRYAYLRLAEKLSSFPITTYSSSYTINSDKKELGSEVDLAILYDYTEDVQFGLNLDVFMPGDFFDSTNDKEAIQALGSMKISF